MATPDEIFAAGLMAKLTGSVLKRVDENTIQMSAAGPANRIDPMAVIRNQAIDPNQQQLLRQVNAEAEAAYPLPQPQFTPPAVIPEPSPQGEFDFGAPSATANAVIANTDVVNTLKSIDGSIKKLITLLEAKWQTN